VHSSHPCTARVCATCPLVEAVFVFVFNLLPCALHALHVVRGKLPSFGVPASPPVRVSGVTFAEPYIMLSQLHWGHSYGPNPTQDAIKYLNELLEMKSAKREFFSNLGLLQYSQHNNGMCVCMCVWGVLVLA
jgi:hypothetical protein